MPEALRPVLEEVQRHHKDVRGIYVVLAPALELPSGQAATTQLHAVQALFKRLLPAGTTLNVIHFGTAPADILLQVAGAGAGRYHAVQVDTATGKAEHPESRDLALLREELTLCDKVLAALDNKVREQDIERARQRHGEDKGTDAPPKAGARSQTSQTGPRPPRTPLPRTPRSTRTQLLRTQPAAATTARTFAQDARESSRLKGIGFVSMAATDVPPQPLRSSAQWLALNSLEAHGLTIYQVLKDVAYTTTKPGRYINEQYKSMATIPWRDGTPRIVHMDPAQLILYRKALLRAFRVYNERIRWLGTGSRRLWGNLAEDVVTLVLDLTLGMQPHLDQLRRHLELVFAEQLPHKKFFNVIKLTGQPERCFHELTAVSPDALQAAWQWICDALIDVQGQRQLLPALVMACDELRPQVSIFIVIVLFFLFFLDRGERCDI